MNNSANTTNSAKFIEDSTSDLLQISDQEFNLMRDLIYDRFGINLSDQKRGLLVTRCNKHMKHRGLKSFKEYYEYLLKDKTGQELSKLADNISTNHTYFMRESEHFDFLQKTALPKIVAPLRTANKLDLRVWCAASSSGEEPYYLAIVLHEFFGMEYSKWNAGLLATDISSDALETAKKGIYKSSSVSSIPIKLREKYFTQLNEENWQVKPKLKADVTFRRFNLMNEKFPFKKPFDIIFCRNVMIYFDQMTIQTLVQKMYDNMAPGGYFFVGHSESLGRIQNPFSYVKPAVYQKI